MSHPVTAWVAAILLFALGCVPIFLIPVNHDVAWYLYAAGRLLDGARLHADVVELNPPLITYLNIAPVLVSRIVGADEVIVFRVGMCVLILVSVGACGWVLREMRSPAPLWVRRALLLLLIFVLLPLPGYFFGQREHLMLVLVMPYVLAQAGRARGARFDHRVMLALGVLAGFGLALKPFFLLCPLVTEAYVAGCRRRLRGIWRPETAGALFVVTAYGAAVALSPEYRSIARMVTQVYPGFHAETRELLLREETLLVGAAVLAFVLLRSTRGARELRWVMLLAALAFMASALIQRKGWGYHFYPCRAGATLLLGLLLLERLARAERAGRGLRRGAAVICLLAAPVLVFIGGGRTMHALGVVSRENARLATAVRARTTESDAILVLSTSVAPAFPLVQNAGCRWASRFCNLWMVPGLYRHVPADQRPFPCRAPADFGAVERYLFDAVVEDLARYSPEVVLVKTPGAGQQGIRNRHFDFVAYFRQDQRFRRLWEGYRPAGETVEAHRIFERVDRGPGNDGAAAAER